MKTGKKQYLSAEKESAGCMRACLVSWLLAVAIVASAIATAWWIGEPSPMSGCVRSFCD